MKKAKICRNELFFKQVFFSLYIGSIHFSFDTHSFCWYCYCCCWQCHCFYCRCYSLRAYVSAERNFPNTVTWMGYFLSATVWQQTITTLFTIWFSIRVYAQLFDNFFYGFSSIYTYYKIQCICTYKIVTWM